MVLTLHRSMAFIGQRVFLWPIGPERDTTPHHGLGRTARFTCLAETVMPHQAQDSWMMSGAIAQPPISGHGWADQTSLTSHDRLELSELRRWAIRPGARGESGCWTGDNGRLYLFGGVRWEYHHYYNDPILLGDLWSFDLTTNQWTCLSDSRGANTGVLVWHHECTCAREHPWRSV